MAANENRNVTIRINGREVANSIKSIEKEFHRLRNEVKKTTRGSDEYNRKMAELRRTKAILDQHRQGIRGVRGAWSGFGNMIKTQLAPLFAIGTLVNVLRGAFNTIRDFGAAQAGLAAVLGKSRAEITALEEQAKKLGATTAFTATEVSNLQKEYAKLGFSEAEILNVTDATLQLAAATGSELAEAAEVAGSTVRAFGLDSSETQRVVDIMAKSFSSSALDLERWKESMKTAAPLASALDLSVEETAAMLGKMADAGLHGSMAGTALKKIFNELSKDGRPLKEVLADVKTQLEAASTPAEKLAIAQGLVKERAQSALLVLAGQTEGLSELKTTLENSGGAAEKMANEQLNTLDGRLKILSSTWDGLILQFSESEGGLMKVVDLITAILSGYQVFVRDMQENFSGLNNSLASLGRSFGAVNEESESTVTAMDLVSTAVRLSMVPLQLFIQTINSIVLGFRALTEGGKVAIDFLSDFSLDDGFSGLQESLDDFGKSIGDMGSTIVDPFVDLFGNNEELKEKLDERTDLIKEAMSPGGSSAGSPESDAANRVIQGTLQRIEAQKISEIDAAVEVEATKEMLFNEGLLRRQMAHEEYLTEEGRREEEQAMENKRARIQMAQGLMSDGFQVLDNALQNETSRQLEALEERKEKGLLSDAQYEAEKEKIQRKAFNRKKILDIAQATINGALAITTALAQTGALAPTVIPGIIASTAGQIAVIASTQYEDGGEFLEGPSHAQGGMPVIDPSTGKVRAEMEGGEFIIRKSSVNAATLPALRSINESGQIPDLDFQGASQNLRFEKGGMFPSMSPGMGSRSESDSLKSIERLLKNMKVKMSLNELEEETERKDKVERLAGIVD